MILKNNRTPLLCYFNLCASFRSHWCIQTGITIRKRPLWVKIDDFFSPVTLKFEGWPWKKKYSTSSKQHQALCIISSSYVNSYWSYSPETVQLSFDLWPWPFAGTLLMSLVITPENLMIICYFPGNYLVMIQIENRGIKSPPPWRWNVGDVEEIFSDILWEQIVQYVAEACI